MKIKIELDSDLKENEIIIRCSSLTEDIPEIAAGDFRCGAGSSEIEFL